MSVSHRWGRGALKEWSMSEADQDWLIEQSELVREVKIAKTPRSTGRARQPKRGKKLCKRTMEMFK